jgi:hypothetical protein
LPKGDLTCRTKKNEGREASFFSAFCRDVFSILMNEQRCSILLDEGMVTMAKRKVAHDAAKKNNFTPKESLPDTEFSVEYSGEDNFKAANRNSKQGRKGKMAGGR